MVDSPGEQQVAMGEVSGITTEPSETLNNITDDWQKFCELIMQVEGKLSLWSTIDFLCLWWSTKLRHALPGGPDAMVEATQNHAKEQDINDEI